MSSTDGSVSAPESAPASADITMMGKIAHHLVNGKVYFFKVSGQFILAKMIRTSMPHFAADPSKWSLVVQRARSHVGETPVQCYLPVWTDAFEYLGKQP
jgi:hypothetical protein